MKKAKLKLGDIHVNSFITTMQASEKMTIQAGDGSWWVSGCIFTLRCPDKAPAPGGFQSEVWTLAPLVQMCNTGASRNDISQLDPQLCPACARPNPKPNQVPIISVGN